MRRLHWEYAESPLSKELHYIQGWFQTSLQYDQLVSVHLPWEMNYDVPPSGLDCTVDKPLIHHLRASFSVLNFGSCLIQHVTYHKLRRKKLFLQAEKPTKWQLQTILSEIGIILSIAQLLTTFIFFSAWDKSRFKWDNFQNQHRKWGPKRVSSLWWYSSTMSYSLWWQGIEWEHPDE